MERKIEFWNKKETGLTREERRTKLRELMMRSESGRALLEKEAADALKHEKEKSEFRSYTPSETTRKKKIDRELEKRSKISDCLLNMCNNKMLPMDASIFDAEGNDILERSGINTGFGLHIPLESRYLGAKTIPIASFIDKYNKAIRNRLVLTRLGAEFIHVTGRSVIPTYSGSTTTWEGENVSAGNGKGTFSKKELTPKRITTKLTVSRQLIAQNGNVDDFIASDLAEAVAEAVEGAVFGKHEHTDTKPDGFFTGGGYITGTATLSSLFEMEEKVKNNGMPMAYCLNPTLERIFKSIERGKGAVIYAGACDDYPYIATDAVPSVDIDTSDAGYGIIFGRWSDLVIAQWGAIEILINPYTAAINNEMEFIVNAYFDFTFRSESFAVAALK